MARSRIELVRAAFEAWNRADIEGTLALITPDFEWRPTGIFPDADPIYSGHEGWRKFWNQFHEAWEYVEVEPGRIGAMDDMAVAEFRFHAKGAGSGVEVDLDLANVYEFRGDLAYRGAAYTSLEQALEAEGLPRGALEDADGDVVPPEAAHDPD